MMPTMHFGGVSGRGEEQGPHARCVCGDGEHEELLEVGDQPLGLLGGDEAVLHDPHGHGLG